MNQDELRLLLGERSALRRILANIPKEDVLDRSSFSSRLEEVEQQIGTAEVVARVPARARLSFRGRPVIGSYGIFAEFGMEATKKFTDAVSMMAAAISGPLATTGPIPNRDQNQLLITNTAVGSFGFEIEEYRSQQLTLEEDSPVAQALRQAQDLLLGTLGNDDDLVEAATGTVPRAIAAMRGFLQTLASNEAVCSVEFADRPFRFTDVGEVHRALERLGQDNLHEERSTLDGAFQGLLPKRRTFEFRVADSLEVINGKVGLEIPDANIINLHLNERVNAQFVATRVGSGRPRYVLNQLPQWRTDEQAAQR